MSIKNSRKINNLAIKKQDSEPNKYFSIHFSIELPQVTFTFQIYLNPLNK